MNRSFQEIWRYCMILLNSFKKNSSPPRYRRQKQMGKEALLKAEAPMAKT